MWTPETLGFFSQKNDRQKIQKGWVGTLEPIKRGRGRSDQRKKMYVGRGVGNEKRTIQEKKRDRGTAFRQILLKRSPAFLEEPTEIMRRKKKIQKYEK